MHQLFFVMIEQLSFYLSQRLDVNSKNKMLQIYHFDIESANNTAIRRQSSYKHILRGYEGLIIMHRGYEGLIIMHRCEHLITK